MLSTIRSVSVELLKGPCGLLLGQNGVKFVTDQDSKIRVVFSYLTSAFATYSLQLQSGVFLIKNPLVYLTFAAPLAIDSLLSFLRPEGKKVEGIKGFVSVWGDRTIKVIDKLAAATPLIASIGMLYLARATITAHPYMFAAQALSTLVSLAFLYADLFGDKNPAKPGDGEEQTPGSSGSSPSIEGKGKPGAVDDGKSGPVDDIVIVPGPADAVS
jgi:hypothetical protein